MDEARNRWPNRCLPLLIANESGWALLATTPFRATWDGGDSPAAVAIEFLDQQPTTAPVASHFGHGIITFRVPYVFRTPPGWNLLVRGPANWPKDGICALEGLVEADWASANFTMNWKLTRAGHPVEFGEGEPFCMLVPQRRGDLEAFRPEIRNLGSDPATQREFEAFADNREQLQVRKFLAEYSREFDAYRNAWEGQYYRGRTPSNQAVPEHQTKIHLSPFRDRSDAEGESDPTQP